MSDVTTGRVLLLKPGDTLIIAGLDMRGEMDHNRVHDALATLKERLNLGRIWIFSDNIDIAKIEIATRLKVEREQTPVGLVGVVNPAPADGTSLMDAMHRARELMTANDSYRSPAAQAQIDKSSVHDKEQP